MSVFTSQNPLQYFLFSSMKSNLTFMKETHQRKKNLIFLPHGIQKILYAFTLVEIIIYFSSLAEFFVVSKHFPHFFS
jgi:hypothetical protein